MREIIKAHINAAAIALSFPVTLGIDPASSNTSVII